MPVSPLVRQLVAARRAQGITQDDLARAVGVGRTTIANWETGHNPPTLEGFVRWATAVGFVVLLVPAETLPPQ